ncbi:MAG TPA: hypothetical protein H9669_03725 [Firmicutes bacterium]|nr:hypothetical protein [Bacillota bacterium]
MEKCQDTFHYTYSAKQQEEISSIRKKYLSQEQKEDKMEQLRRLDQGATKKGTAISIVIGIIGCLLLGVGMCCTMVWMEHWFIPGVILGMIGIAIVAVAYPVYLHITKKEREKIAPQILKLAEDLSKPE